MKLSAADFLRDNPVPLTRPGAILVLLVVAFAAPGAGGRGSQTAGAPAAAAEKAVLVATGDIANCELRRGAEATARLLDSIEGTVITLGDHAYEQGTARQFQECYDPTWGRHKARTRPTPGNHDYLTGRGAPYYAYFGENAGPAGRGYYSYDVGAWHVISLNSNVSPGLTSTQVRWLRNDLEANPRDCTLAYWHIPVFTSGGHGNNPLMRDVWRVLYEFGADVVLNAHDHDYERFAPQDPDGKADPERGIRQFVVGTGGAGVYRFGPVRPNSEVRSNSAYGVLKLTLDAASYAWEFVPVAGQAFKDSGSAPCVALTRGGARSSDNQVASFEIDLSRQ